MTRVPYVMIPASAAFTFGTAMAKSFGMSKVVAISESLFRPALAQNSGLGQPTKQMKVHTMFVIGKRDMDASAVSVRIHGKGNLGAKPRTEAIANVLSSIRTRAP